MSRGKDKARIAAAARDTLLRVTRDAGREHYASAPDAMLVTVARHAAKLFPDDPNLQIAFLQGYVEARQHHDEFKRGE